MRKDDPELKRTPRFASRATCAAEFEVSLSTWDEWVKAGVVPQPYMLGRSGSTPRWDIEEVFNSVRDAGKARSAAAVVRDDPYLNLSALRGGYDGRARGSRQTANKWE